MKRIIYQVVVSCTIAVNIHSTYPDDFDLILEPQWKNLEHGQQRAEEFGGKWILVGSITFRKKSKDTVHLNKLYLRWKGDKIPQLTGSLYKKNLDKKFLPIEDNLVCDGCWNKSKQVLKLRFDEKQTLGPINIFYLVLTIPSSLEQTIKDGRFDIVSNSLPEQYKICTRKQTSSLAFSELPKTTLATTIDAEL